MAVHTLIKALGIELDIHLGHRTLTKFHPRTRAEDTLAIHVHPGLQIVEYLRLFLVVGTIGSQGDTQQQITILRHDINQLLYHSLGTLILIFLIDTRLIVPVTNTVTRLPRLRYEFIGRTALHIPCQGFLLVFAQNLSKYYALRVLIIKMCSNLQSAIAHRIEGQHGYIEINQVGMIAIDGVEGTIIEVSHKLL